MESFKPFQPLITVRASADEMEVIQSPSGYLDAGDATKVTVHVEIFCLANGTLYLETTPSEEGPWQEVQSWTAAGDVTIDLLTYYSAEHPLARFVRWRFEASDAGAVACFQLRYH